MSYWKRNLISFCLSRLQMIQRKEEEIEKIDMQLEKIETLLAKNDIQEV